MPHRLARHSGIVFSSSSLLGAIGIAMGLMAMVMLYTSYLLALKDMRFIKVLIMSTVLEVLFLSVFHNSLLQVIYALILTATLTLLLLITLGLKLRKKIPELSF